MVELDPNRPINDQRVILLTTTVSSNSNAGDLEFSDYRSLQIDGSGPSKGNVVSIEGSSVSFLGGGSVSIFADGLLGNSQGGTIVFGNSEDSPSHTNLLVLDKHLLLSADGSGAGISGRVIVNLSSNLDLNQTGNERVSISAQGGRPNLSADYDTVSITLYGPRTLNIYGQGLRTEAFGGNDGAKLAIKAETVKVEGRLVADSANASAGTITIDSKNIALTSESIISANGAVSAGTISLGTENTTKTITAHGQISALSTVSAESTGVHGSISLTAGSLNLSGARLTVNREGLDTAPDFQGQIHLFAKNGTISMNTAGLLTGGQIDLESTGNVGTKTNRLSVAADYLGINIDGTVGGANAYLVQSGDLALNNSNVVGTYDLLVISGSIVGREVPEQIARGSQPLYGEVRVVLNVPDGSIGGTTENGGLQIGSNRLSFNSGGYTNIRLLPRTDASFRTTTIVSSSANTGIAIDGENNVALNIRGEQLADGTLSAGLRTTNGSILVSSAAGIKVTTGGTSTVPVSTIQSIGGSIVLAASDSISLARNTIVSADGGAVILLASGTDEDSENLAEVIPGSYPNLTIQADETSSVFLSTNWITPVSPTNFIGAANNGLVVLNAGSQPTGINLGGNVRILSSGTLSPTSFSSSDSPSFSRSNAVPELLVRRTGSYVLFMDTMFEGSLSEFAVELLHGSCLISSRQEARIFSSQFDLKLLPGALFHVQRTTSAVKIKNVSVKPAFVEIANISHPVKIEAGQELSIHDGREVRAEDGIGRRNLQPLVKYKPTILTVAEFSLSSALANDRLLLLVRESQNILECKKALQSIYKTAAALALATSSHGLFK